MRAKSARMAIIAVFALIAAGCGPQKPDESIAKSAIDTQYSARPECLWATPVQFPAKLRVDNTLPTPAGHMLRYDVLTDAGLLTRTEQQAKRNAAQPALIDLYDLSPQGHAAWTADLSQPGYGNFCFGHREVTSIGKLTTKRQGGIVTASVSYQYDLAGVPDWAKSLQVQTAFPNVKRALTGPKTAQAELIKNGNEWEFKPGTGL